MRHIYLLHALFFVGVKQHYSFTTRQLARVSGNFFTLMTTRKKSSEISSDDSTPLKGKGSSQTLFIPDNINAKRCRLLTRNTEVPTGDCVIYWMSRDQRAYDNWALIYAQGLAIEKKVPLIVVFNLVPRFLEATIRQYGFMLRGLEEVEEQLRELQIPFCLLMGDPTVNIPQFAQSKNAFAVVTDFSPLRIGLGWKRNVANAFDSSTRKIPLIEIDAHNIIPCWEASPKLEYGARTIRSKINNKIPEFLVDIPAPLANPVGSLDGYDRINWKEALDSLEINRDVPEVNWIKPGYTAGMNMLQSFIDERLKDYAEKRNNPNHNQQSNLSPYFHFGQISVQRVVLCVKGAKRYGASTDSFVEEAVVRRELSDNFCYYNPHYDQLDGCYDWARTTLEIHSNDPRSPLYDQTALEEARTHDDLWNAAQIQLTEEGKQHGFLRMYWAKKILEWTVSPQEALRIAIYFNDKYSLDGRDPNGYVGCMWSIGGVHDQGWGERPIFGKIRYMNYEGCKRKFDVKAFVSKYPRAALNAIEASNASGSGSGKRKIQTT